MAAAEQKSLDRSRGSDSRIKRDPANCSVAPWPGLNRSTAVYL